MTTSTIIAILVLLLVPLVLVWRLTETRTQTIQRLRRTGQTWKQIATRYGCSQSTVRRWAAA